MLESLKPILVSVWSLVWPILFVVFYLLGWDKKFSELTKYNKVLCLLAFIFFVSQYVIVFVLLSSI